MFSDPYFSDNGNFGSEKTRHSQSSQTVQQLVYQLINDGIYMQNERTVNILVHLLIIVQWQSVKKLNQTVKCR